eukprot:TRINITY_DN55299_c0_g1_i1.p1 TRINITY_DN55299_c0_g1~~TRINITY_DN55299_c0_g1_i1.p1  ORF type:complete len:368 (+),score=63.02 TRINITY_DN55299_c0_g1_i1:84-1187(+)
MPRPAALPLGAALSPAAAQLLGLRCATRTSAVTARRGAAARAQAPRASPAAPRRARSTLRMQRRVCNTRAEDIAALHEELNDQRDQVSVLRADVSALRQSASEQMELLRLIKADLEHGRKTLYSAAACDVAASKPPPADAGELAVDPVWPTLAVVEAQPRVYRELSNEALATLAAQGQRGMHAAHRERLIREIMRVDRCSWEDAQEKLHEMDDANEKIYWILTGPHRIGICLGVAAGFASVPMVFSKQVAGFFAANFVGVTPEDWPEDFDTLTAFQIGTWSWDWMEPLLGTASFVLLAAQFVRSNVKKMNTKPYTELVLSWRADRLTRLYPRYDRTIVRDWAKNLPRVGLCFFPEYERNDCNPYVGI